MSKHAHLLKVLVQTIWVVVDDKDGSAIEMTDSGLIVSAKEWPDFFDKHSIDFKAIQDSVSSEQ